jgi:ankyrin repeat protein
LQCQDSHGFTPIYTACLLGHVEIIEILLEAGADVTISDLGGLTPLHIAAEKGYDAAVSVLLRCKKCDPYALDSIGRDALAWASAKGNTACIQLLASEVAT